jgi:hypothetical protein
MLCLIFLMSASAVLTAGVSASHPGDSSDGAFPGLAASGNTATSVVNTSTNATFGGLQAAIDAASPGDTIDVVANITEGQIIVNTNNLTLTTSNGSTVSMGVDTTPAGDGRAWFLVPSGTNLTVTNLTFNGNGFRVYQAFRHKGTGSFTNCNFEDIEYELAGSDTVGSAIVSFPDTPNGGGVGVSVSGCSFTEIGLHGLFAFDSTCSVDDSTFVGVGAIGDRVTYAIEAGNGANVTASNNSITACRGTVGGNASAAVLSTTFFGPGTSVSLTSNDIRDNSFGVLTTPVDGSTISGAFNNFVGNSTGVSVDPAASLENNWWGCNGGPGTAGCDASIGGGDTNPWLVLTLDPPPVGTTPETCLVYGDSAIMTANLNINSDGATVGGPANHVPDGAPVAWDGQGVGSFNPPITNLVDGATSSVYTQLGFNGLYDFCATTDNAVVCQPIYIGVTKIPTLTEYGMMAFIALLATAAVVMMRRQRAGA